RGAGGGWESVRLKIVLGEMKAGHLGNSIGRAGVKQGLFVLRYGRHLAEHLTRTGKVEATGRDTVFERCQDVVCATDVGLEGGGLILERVADITLGRQMIALVGV